MQIIGNFCLQFFFSKSSTIPLKVQMDRPLQWQERACPCVKMMLLT